ncbi:hypothetical protein OSTOST_19904, partial [Ostertagia ostertagi]
VNRVVDSSHFLVRKCCCVRIERPHVVADDVELSRPPGSRRRGLRSIDSSLTTRDMQAGLLLLLGLFAGTLAAPKPSLDDESRMFILPEDEMQSPEIDEQPQDDEAEEQNEAFILPVSKPLGEVSGLAIDPKGRLVAFHRADREWNEK